MKVENLVPEVYYQDSRDFAFVGRCFEVIFNYMKTSAQCVNVNYLTEAIDSNVIELMADTVGFTAKHKYDNKNLLAVAGSFQNLLRNKGSLYAIELAVTILMNAQKITKDTFSNEGICEVDPYDPFNIIIRVSDKLSDIVLLEDIFDYILPAGMTYEIIRNADSPDMLTTYIGDEHTVLNAGAKNNTDIVSFLHDEEELELPDKGMHKGLNVAQIATYITDN